MLDGNKKMIINASIDRIKFNNQIEFDKFIQENLLSDCDQEEADGQFFITCIIINIEFSKTIRLYLSQNQFNNLYKESRGDKIIASITSEACEADNILKVTDNRTIDTITIDKIKKKILKDLDQASIPEEIQIHSSLSKFFDFEWEDFYDSVKVKRFYLSAKYNPNFFKFDLDHVLFLISRASPKNSKITKEIEEELLNFQIRLTKTNRIYPIKSVTFKYLHDKYIMDEENLFILNVVGHGDKDGSYYCENCDTEGDYTKFSPLNKEGFVSLFNQVKIKILNLSFCYSGRNIEILQQSLPCNLIDKGIAEYVIATKYSVGSKYMAAFNKYFYDNLFDKVDNQSNSRIEDSFFDAKNRIESEYKDKDELCCKNNLILVQSFQSS